MQKITMDVPTKAVTKSNDIIKVVIKVKPLNDLYKFEKLINAIEKHVLKNFTWQRTGDLDTIGFDFAVFCRFAKPIVVSYDLGANIEVDLLEQYKSDILQEADIRGFVCNIR